MKPATIAGLVLVVLGAGALLLGGFSYTDREQVLDVGPLQADVETEERVVIPPIVSGLVLAAGVVLLFVGSRQRT